MKKWCAVLMVSLLALVLVACQPKASAVNPNETGEQTVQVLLLGGERWQLDIHAVVPPQDQRQGLNPEDGMERLREEMADNEIEMRYAFSDEDTAGYLPVDIQINGEGFDELTDLRLYVGTFDYSARNNQVEFTSDGGVLYETGIDTTFILRGGSVVDSNGDETANGVVEWQNPGEEMSAVMSTSATLMGLPVWVWVVIGGGILFLAVVVVVVILALRSSKKQAAAPSPYYNLPTNYGPMPTSQYQMPQEPMGPIPGTPEQPSAVEPMFQQPSSPITGVVGLDDATIPAPSPMFTAPEQTPSAPVFGAPEPTPPPAPAPTFQAAPVFCMTCGTKIPEGGRFCPKCGAKVG